MFLPGWRRRFWDALDRPFDVLVIGGGITGAGVLHDAARRGLRVALVERGDFASGTSSRSSKLIHGGLRYLKRMQLRITRTASRERDLLAMHNPHLVSPVRFLYPSYRDDPTPGWQVALGLSMYDHLSPIRHRHERVDAERVLEMVPSLAADGLEFGLLYDDALADDARLVLAAVTAGVLAGGVALNHAPAENLLRGPSGRIRGAVVRDRETGAVQEVRAAVVVNATGVWCDRVRELAGRSDRRLRPSRGAHILFDGSRLPLEDAVTGLSPDDGRPVFAVPHPEGVLVGTTDRFHDGSLDDPRPAASEIDYLLRFVSSAFPGRHLGRADITGAFAGVRPILGNDVDDPSKASREEEVWEEDGLVSTAGGKLTTYRATAEEVVDRVVAELPEERRAVVGPGCPVTASLPWRISAEALDLAAAGATPAVAAAMARRLGSLALAACGEADPSSLRPVADDLDLCACELSWHARHSAVVHLDDLLLRRVRLGMWSPHRCLAVAPSLRRILRRELGWSVRRWREELVRLDDALAGWRPPEVR